MSTGPAPGNTPPEQTVQSGDQQAPGTPVEQQPSAPPVVQAPSVQTAPPVQAPPPVAAPPPAPAPTPAPAGPTQDAEPSNQVKPEIPDDLKAQQYKSFVRVKVIVHTDGSFDPVLRTSSGNAEIDKRVLDALKRWTWKPALKEGKSIESTAYFRFEFEVN
jgi:protein TonB